MNNTVEVWTRWVKIDGVVCMICDIDHVDAVAVKETLRYDPYVYAIWISPSGDGVKFLMKISDQ